MSSKVPQHETFNPVWAEDIVIGQVLYEPGCIGRAAAILKPDHFYGIDHRTVFVAALDLWREGTAVDLITMYHILHKRGELEKIGGAYRLSKWTNAVAQTIHLEDHCDIIKEQYALRVLKSSAYHLQNVNASDNPNEIIARHNEDIAKASSVNLGDDKNGADVAYRIMNDTVRKKPLKLGIAGVDDTVSVGDDSVIVFTAPSGVGKTAAAMTAIVNMIHERKPWIVSLEMTADELMTRVLCGFAGVEINAAMDGKLTDGEKDRMTKANIDHYNITSRLDICDDDTMTIDQFRARADHKVKNEGCQIIMIDYGQLMGADPSQYKNTTEKHEVVSRGIKATTKALKVPIILIVQLNKDGEIYGSGQYEKDAHVVIQFFPPDGSNRMPYHIRKNRNGRTGKASTPCDLAFGLVGRMCSAYTGPARPHPDNRTTPKKEDSPDDIAPF